MKIANDSPDMVHVALTVLTLGALYTVAALGITCADPKTHDRERWAADAGHAEFYLDAKTGKVEWRWKPLPMTYLTTGSVPLVTTNPSPYWSTK